MDIEGIEGQINEMRAEVERLNDLGEGTGD